MNWNVILWTIAIWAKIANIPVFFVDSDLFESFNANTNINDNFGEFIKTIREINNRKAANDNRYSSLDNSTINTQIEKNNKIVFHIYEEMKDIRNFLIKEDFFRRPLITEQEDLNGYVKNKIDNLIKFIIERSDTELAKSDKNTLIIDISIIIEESLVYNNALRNQLINLLISSLFLL